LCVLQRTYQNSEFDSAMATLRKLADAKTAAEVKDVWGEPKNLNDPRKSDRNAMIDELKNRLPHEEIEINNLEGDWLNMDVPALNERARRLLGYHVRLGSLIPTEKHLSKSSGLAPSDPAAWKTTSEGNLTERLPAQNVAALGKSLFSDYLVPVELAGVLLLVA